MGKGESNDERGGPGTPLDISQPITTTPQEPWVQLMVTNKLIDYLVDTEATYSVLNTKLSKKSSDAVMVTAVTEQVQKQVFYQLLE